MATFLPHQSKACTCDTYTANTTVVFCVSTWRSVSQCDSEEVQQRCSTFHPRYSVYRFKSGWVHISYNASPTQRQLFRISTLSSIRTEEKPRIIMFVSIYPHLDTNEITHWRRIKFLNSCTIINARLCDSVNWQLMKEETCTTWLRRKMICLQTWSISYSTEKFT